MPPEPHLARTLVLASTFTADPVKEPIVLWLERIGLALRVELAPYDQVFQELLNPESLFGRNRDGVNAILLRVEDWLGRHARPSEMDAAAIERMRGHGRELAEALSAAASRNHAPHVLVFAPPSPAMRARAGLAAALDEVELALSSAVAALANVDVVGSRMLAETYPVAHYYDADTDELGHVPYTAEMFAALGTAVVRKCYLRATPPYKVLALDCDNTLWKGIVGEDGPRGVEIDAARRALQFMAVAQQQAGVLVCLCSKNNEPDVWEVFDAQPDMPLRREHIVASRIGWQPKSQSLRALALDLNLGLDSFVFLDDNPQEIEEARAGCPEVLALRVPTEAPALLRFLRQTWIFDRRAPTAEDQKRTEMYRQEAARKELQHSAPSFEAFLAGLELVVDVAPLQSAFLPRASQLTERTNQLNTTTIRRSESELTAALADGLEARTVSVRDRFGDYGLVGLVLFRAAGEALEIDSFMLSCRVLGKGVEQRIMHHLASVAREQRRSQLVFRYAPTKKNAPARAFLESLGASRTDPADGTRYVLSTEHAGALAISASIELPAEAPAQAAAPASQTRLAKALEQLGDMADVARLGAVRQTRAAETRFVAPHTPREQTLADLFAELLRLDRVGIDDHFLALGGHSLVGMQLSARVRSIFGVELSLRALFDHPTVESLAAHIDSLSAAAVDTAAEPRPALAPLSFGQQAFWRYAGAAQRTGKMYFAMRLEGPLRLDALEHALSQIVARHEVLRSVATVIDGVPLLRVTEARPVRVELEDLSGLDEHAFVEAAAERVQRELDVGFDRETGPLFRMMLMRAASEDHVLGIVIDEIACDFLSIDVFTRELSGAYRAFASGEGSSLPVLSAQVADVASWQKRRFTEATIAAEHAYWRAYLRGAPTEIALPFDRPRSGERATKYIETPIDPRRIDALRTAAAQHGGLFVTLWTAFAATLSIVSAQDDLVIGTAHAGRDYPGALDLIGPFSNAMVVRLQVAKNETLGALRERLRGELLDVFEHAELPHAKVIEALQPPPRPGRPPLFNVSMQVHHVDTLIDLGAVRGRRIELPLRNNPHAVDLYLHFWLRDDLVLMKLAYNPQLFDETTATRIASLNLEVLDRLVDDPGRLVGELAGSSSSAG